MNPGRHPRAARAETNGSQEALQKKDGNQVALQKKGVASQTWRKTDGEAKADAGEVVVDTEVGEIIAAGGDAVRTPGVL